jgi:enamine deaminase RidA (YjgF/YER057c/UK114 family)
MCGNTTTSRSGSRGYRVKAGGVSFISGMCGFPQQNQ